MKDGPSATTARWIVTGGSLVLLVGHLLWPRLEIDFVSFGLLVMALLPWLSSLIRSAEFPGGWKVEFQELKTAVDKASLTESPPVDGVADNDRPIYGFLAERDPNLALVGLRIELERRLRAMGRRLHLSDSMSLSHVVDELATAAVLSNDQASGLKDLIRAGNKAAHGAQVDAGAAQLVVDRAPAVLRELDARSKLKWPHDNDWAGE